MKKLNILFEDKHMVIINKEGGLSTIKTPKDNINLYSYVYDYLHKKNQKVFIVHRLDKDTSGLIIFAKSERVKNELQNNWDKVIRKYVSIVHGKTEETKTIKTKIYEDKTYKSHVSNSKGKDAITIYNTVKQNNNFSLINIEIKTGRKNQIRLHLSNNNNPILGDRKYGIKDSSRKLMLLANYLEFIHPITKEIIIINLDIPKEYYKYVN